MYCYSVPPFSIPKKLIVSLPHPITEARGPKIVLTVNKPKDLLDLSITKLRAKPQKPRATPRSLHKLRNPACNTAKTKSAARMAFKLTARRRGVRFEIIDIKKIAMVMLFLLAAKFRRSGEGGKVSLRCSTSYFNGHKTIIIRGYHRFHASKVRSFTVFAD